MFIVCLFSWRYNLCGCIFTDRQRALASSFSRFLDHTQRRTTVGRTPLHECSIRRRDLYLTTHNTHNRRTSMPPVGFEPIISAGERPKTYALDRAATGNGSNVYYIIKLDSRGFQTVQKNKEKKCGRVCWKSAGEWYQTKYRVRKIEKLIDPKYFVSQTQVGGFFSTSE